MKPITAIFVFFLLFAASANAKNLVVVLSPYQSPQAAQAQVKTVLQFLTALPPAGSAKLMDGDSLQTIADFRVPENPAYNGVKARLKVNGQAVASLLAFAKRAHAPLSDTAPRVVQAVNLPQVLRHIAQNLPHDAPLDVVVLGSPLYDAAQEPEFSMAEGLVPADGHLQTTRSKTPFGVDDAHALQAIRLHLAYADEGVFMTDQHRYVVERFWSLFLSVQGGALVSFTADLPSLFERVQSGAPAPQHHFELEQTDKLDMLRLRRAKLSQSLYERPLSRLFLPKSQIGQADHVEIGINWDCARCDLDLYARPFPGAEVLYFGRNQTPQGEHVKDFMSAPQGQNSYETVFFTTPVDLNALDIVVNFYQGSAPAGVHGTLRLSANGQTYAQAFTLAATTGNRAQGVETTFNTGLADNRQTVVIDPAPIVTGVH